MFIGLLSACTIESFGDSVACDLKGPIKCISLNNQRCKTRPGTNDTNSNETFFIHLLLLLIRVVEVVTLLMIHMLEFVFQIK